MLIAESERPEMLSVCRHALLEGAYREQRDMGGEHEGWWLIQALDQIYDRGGKWSESFFMAFNTQS